MKLKLKVELIGDRALTITIIYIADEAMMGGSYIDRKVYTNYGVTIWSFSDFIFDIRQIRLPENGNRITKGAQFSHTFISDKERYGTMKKYYHVLNEWALCTKIFPNTNESIKNRVKIVSKI
jgi:hypothetical protein